MADLFLKDVNVNVLTADTAAGPPTGVLVGATVKFGVYPDGRLDVQFGIGSEQLAALQSIVESARRIAAPHSAAPQTAVAPKQPCRTIAELEAALRQIRARHGDLPVVTMFQDRLAPYRHDWLEVTNDETGQPVLLI
jgi:hypothetical protein